MVDTARMSSGENPAASLLSLSIAAASAAPVPIARESPPGSSFAPGSFDGASSFPSNGHSTISASARAPGVMKHRRMSSTGLAKRRLSDAREAASRPSAVTIQTAAAALSSLATLSLSGSPPPQGVPQTSASFASASGMMHSIPSAPVSSASNPEEEESQNIATTEISAGGISIKNGGGKKRGTIFKCESCSKVYRHPSCLVKHRWEHSPHWREASKFLLSKHQQVQLLEAAAILSHMSPSAVGGNSLPEDKGLWPAYLSGGVLPSAADAAGTTKQRTPAPSSFENRPTFPTSSSVPATTVLASSTSSGPRMHDYAIPSTGGITHVRPGVLGVPTGPNTAPSMAIRRSPSYNPDVQSSIAVRPMPVPVPVPNSTTTYRDGGNYSFASAGSPEPWSSYRSSSVSASFATGGGGWSLPRSSVRSGSAASDSRSRSGSVPKSDMDDEGDYVDVGVDGDGDDVIGPGGQRYGFVSRGRTSAARHEWKMDEEGAVVVPREEKIEEEWDGMDMDMEM